VAIFRAETALGVLEYVDLYSGAEVMLPYLEGGVEERKQVVVGGSEEAVAGGTLGCVAGNAGLYE
tara:strand:- start:100 stop:294 length:195 start_codon:yes stop_codon:yes gene_type:complete